MSEQRVAAERTLTLKHESGVEDSVVVRVFVPHPIEQGDWQCDYQIKGGPVNLAHRTVGIDSTQALMLALGGLKGELSYLERKHKAQFHFLGEPGHEFKDFAA